MIVAIETTGDQAAIDVTGATVIGTATQGQVTTTLVRIAEAGLKLIRVNGTGSATIRVSLAGDINRDGAVNGIDTQAWEQALADAGTAGDINADGVVNFTDRQVLYANYGWKANQAPVAAAALPGIKTHTDLAITQSLDTIAQDLEGEAIFWRVLGATHGTAKLSADGQNLFFTPETGYAGQAIVTVQADDGFAASAPIELTVNVSGAKLLAIHLAPLPQLQAGQFAVIQATADFADETGVDVSASGSYLTVSNASLTNMGLVGTSAVEVDDSRDLVRADSSGPALIIVTRIDTDGRTVRAVAAINSNGDNADGTDPLIIQPDVYPATFALEPGGTRQLKVHLLDPNTGVQTDIRTANQTVFAGTPESSYDYLDPSTQDPLLDPDTGDIMVDPDTGEVLLDPNTGVTIHEVIPAIPPVYSGTRYIVSDESIATVDDNGLVTAIGDGQVTISIIHLASVADESGTISQQVVGQSNITLHVQTAQVTDEDDSTAAPRTIMVAKDIGGVVSDGTGETVLIGAGSLKADAAVSISRINIDDIEAVTGMQIPVPGAFQAVGAFHLDVGDDRTNYRLQVAIPVQDGITTQAGEEVLFLRKGTILQSDGTYKDTWWVVDNGFIGADGVARTASPPYAGIDSGGEYLLCKSIPGVLGGTFDLMGGGALSFGGMSIMADAITSDMIGIAASMATTGSALQYHFGIPQFAKDITLPQIPQGDTFTLDLSTVVPTTPTPYGNVVLPVITAAETYPDLGVINFTVSNDNPGDFKGKIEVRALFPDGSYKVVTTVPGTSNGQIMVTVPTATDTVPAFAIGSVRWQLVRVLATTDLSNGWETDGEPLEFAGNTLRISPKSDMAAVLNRTGITFVRENKPVGETNLLGILGNGNDFDGTYLTGNKVQPVVFSDDLSRVFVGGKDVIYEIDTLSFRLINKIPVAGSKGIASLATVGNLLLIGEGQLYGSGPGNARLLAMDITPGSKTNYPFVSLKGTGIENTPFGVSGMAMGPDGKTLVVATPIERNSANLGDPTKRGNILIFDLDTLDMKTGKVGTPIIADLPSDNISGKAPQVITATKDPDHFLVADVADYNRGLSTLTIKRDPDTGKLISAKMDAIRMFQDRVVIDRLDIQRAQSAVLVEKDGVQYAIVSDDNYHFLDPYWKAMYEAPTFIYTPSGPPLAIGGSASAKKVAVGGKLGIVRDPFGPTPQYLGATLPLDGYGIVNLSLSEDGQVLIGQLKGGFSANIFDSSQQKPHQNHAWRVAGLIDAALAMTDEQRAIKHIKLDPEAEQLIPPSENLAAPAGTSFDPPIIQVSAQGNMGDVIEVDLKRSIAHALLKLPAPSDNLSADDKQKIAAKQSQVDEIIANLSDFTFDAGEKEKLTSSATQDTRGMTLVTENNAKKTVVSQTAAGASADFKTEGRFYVAPNITKADEDKLRLGGVITAGKTQIINLTYKLNKDIGDLKKGFGKVGVTVNAKDYSSANNVTFFGDRPLDAPGYSAFMLKGGVDGSATDDMLDVYRVEQRLRYLGYSSPGSLANGITVDGVFKPGEAEALKFFEKVVRYQSVTATGKNTTGTVTVEVQWRATIDASKDNVKLEEVPGSLIVSSSTAKPKASDIATALAEARKDAKAKARQAAGFKDDKDTTGGMDGKIESDKNNAQRKTTIGWLNAYNAPHWMQFFEGDSTNGYAKTNGKLGEDEWTNLQTGGTNKNDVFGTSWVFDLMQASGKAAVAQGRGKLLFNGTGPLGTMLYLGINPEYISKDNQGKVDGKDVVTGLITDTPPSVIGSAQGKSDYQNKQWSYENASALSGLLMNPNLDNYDTASKTFGAKTDNKLGANRQDEALRDFIAVYSATRSDVTQSKNGSYEEQLTNIKSGKDEAQNKAIQAALFGDGTQVGGVIDSKSVMLGGTAAPLGSAMTSEFLSKFMGDVNGVNYGDWVEPLQKAMVEFDINTPQRIAAFLAQARKETGGLKKMKEDVGPYRVAVVLDTFVSGFTYDGVNNMHQASTTVSAREARYLNLQDFVKNTLGLNTLEGKKLSDPGVDAPIVNGKKDYSQSMSIATGTAWDAVSDKFADRVYSEDLGPKGTAGNGKAADGTAHNFIGRGFFHLTNFSNYSAFLKYAAANFPELVPDFSGKTAQQIEDTLKKTPSLTNLVSANTQNGRLLSAFSGAWYWAKHAIGGKNLNGLADDLTWSDPVLATDQIRYNKISAGIATKTDSFPERWFFYSGLKPKANGIVPPAIKGGNPYDNLRTTLGRLGVSTQTGAGYQSKFGINLNLRKPIIFEPNKNLLAQSTPAISNDLSNSLSELLTEAKAELGIQEGDCIMWTAEPPVQPVAAPQAVYVVAKSNPQGVSQKDRILGVCQLVEINTGDEPKVTLFPVSAADGYMYMYEKKGNFFGDGTRAKVTLLTPPKHGKLEMSDGVPVAYVPNEGYDGKDGLVVQVEQDGVTVKVQYFILVDYAAELKYIDCVETPKGEAGWWKISTDSPQSLDLATVQRNAILSALLADASQALTGFADLPDGAVGQTAGTNITLDTSAAGHNWFIDPTPLDNADEFLPTADATIWKAKAGSAVDGKMDMLSVLLHEYGHALGLEHSADTRDFMSPTLQPGERRLPTADELTLMSQLSSHRKAIV